MKSIQEEYNQVFKATCEAANEKYKQAAQLIKEANQILKNSFEAVDFNQEPIDIDHVAYDNTLYLEENVGIKNLDCSHIRLNTLKSSLDFKQITDELSNTGWTTSMVSCPY